MLGVGLAITFVPLQNLALLRVEHSDAGVASAALTATQQIGGSTGTAVFTAIYAVSSAHLTTLGRGPSLDSMVNGYTTVFSAAAIGLAVVAPITWVLVKVDRRIFSISNDAPTGQALTRDPQESTHHRKG